MVPEPKTLWVGGSVEGDLPCYYKGLIEFFPGVTFSGDYETDEDLRYYIRSVALEHPDWRVAVIGAMYEDEIMRVANAIQESGLTRYSISCTGFVNLDELMAFRSEQQRLRMLDDDEDALEIGF
ncbi:MAG: hypothetical protein ACOYYS_23435 [Chloroflexota bacterium]